MRLKLKKIVLYLLVTLLLCFLSLYYLQRFFAHRHEYFVPDYPRVAITENTDYETIFLQTGLGKSAVQKLIEQNKFQTVLDAQEAFFNPPKANCVPLFGWFTRRDKFPKKEALSLVDLEPGDIIVSLSTHTVGWRHGHAGLVLSNKTSLECVSLGQNSAIMNTSHWGTYSNFAVLRLKNVSPEIRAEVADYAKETLCDVPYRLSAGFIGRKAPDTTKPYFGMQCAYLVWYTWNHFGYDLDSDGGRLVTSADLLNSDLVEVVQVYGMDPLISLLF